MGIKVTNNTVGVKIQQPQLSIQHFIQISWNLLKHHNSNRNHKKPMGMNKIVKTKSTPMPINKTAKNFTKY